MSIANSPICATRDTAAIDDIADAEGERERATHEIRDANDERRFGR